MQISTSSGGFSTVTTTRTPDREEKSLVDKVVAGEPIGHLERAIHATVPGERVAERPVEVVKVGEPYAVDSGCSIRLYQRYSDGSTKEV